MTKRMSTLLPAVRTEDDGRGPLDFERPVIDYRTPPAQNLRFEERGVTRVTV